MTTTEELTLDMPLKVLEELVAKAIDSIGDLRMRVVAEYGGGKDETELSDALAGQLLIFTMGMEHAAGSLADEARKLAKVVEQAHAETRWTADNAYYAEQAAWYKERAELFAGFAKKHGGDDA
jgi:hypothetical protein